MVKTHREKFLEALDAFEDAHHEVCFQGTIPVVGQDREEQAHLDAAHRRISRNYTYRRNRLIRLGTEAVCEQAGE